MTSKMALSMVLVVRCAGCTDKKETKASDVPAVASRPSAATATAAPETADPLVEATAQQLFIAYRQNEIGADAKYRNKLVRVIGEVTRVIRDGESGAFLFLDAPDVAKDMEVIRARFSEANDAGTLKDGDFATIRCRGKGLLGKQVQLDSCALETDKNETPIPVTADQLCANFKKSKDDALIKYEGRPLLVSGSISRVGVNLMEAKDPPVVVFATTSGEMQARLNVDAPRSLKRGQKLTLRCSWDGSDFVTPVLGCTIPQDETKPAASPSPVADVKPAEPASEIPAPNSANITVDTAIDGPQPADVQKRWAEGAASVWNYCRAAVIEGDRFRDVWHTASVSIGRNPAATDSKSLTFFVKATFDDRRRSVHKGAVAIYEVDGKLTRIRPLDESARRLCGIKSLDWSKIEWK